MSQITDYFTQAELALAAYANLLPNVDPVPALTDDAVGMSATQAASFASRWRVVEQYNHTEVYEITDEFGQPTGEYGTTSNGLSATVFEEVATGKRHLAVRGTQPSDFADLGTDLVSIVVIGSPEHQAQYQSLRTKVRQWLDNGTLSDVFTELKGSETFDFPSIRDTLRRGILRADFMAHIVQRGIHFQADQESALAGPRSGIPGRQSPLR